MICSTSTTKSTTNWLDRLRSTKEFPPLNDNADLEDFLSRNPNSNPHSTPQNTDQNQVTDRPKQHDPDENRTKRDDWFDISTALAELFDMGESKRFGCCETKSSQKKREGGGGGGDGVAALLPSSADNNVAGTKTKKRSGGGDRDRFAATMAEADRYSRVDVTVIDMSVPVWRSEKVIFRKGSVWKVRDKNSKCRKISSLRKKKRKESQFDEEVEGMKKEKRRKKKRKKKKKQKVYVSFPSLPPPPRPCPGDLKEVRVPNDRVDSFVEVRFRNEDLISYS
ncbi:hypothetical protein Sjap_006002 [Stephania japonica]|uniref:Uncharacterized protein n=1 Tax=Stephania japonica TaxID=461633 RepID=A0AAP0K6M5_9MAGN